MYPKLGLDSSLVSRALRLISEGALDADGVERLADRLGVTSRHLRRLFLRHLGAAPMEVALIGRTCARTATELRRLARQRTARDPECYRFRLAYRPPYDWDAVLAFLSARATPGVEFADGSRYRRTITVDGQHGSIDVSPLEPDCALCLKVRFPNPRPLLFIVEQVRRMFDLGADPAVIGEHLGADPLLRRPLAKHPGIRTPGAWDGFELAVRAILGPQVSVRAATTVAGRLASMFGSPVAPDAGLSRVFPTPIQLANAPVERTGVMPSRATTIRCLARRVAEAAISFSSSADRKTTISALEALPGIGRWTAGYIAMRALGEPDAFPSGDLVLRRVTGHLTPRELDRRSEAWRPWRAYAVMLLWQA